MTSDNDTFFGIPIPYASTELLTPKNTINKLIEPYKFWEFIIFISGFVIIMMLYFISVLGYNYSSTLFGASGVLTSFAFGYRILPDTNKRIITHNIPSISGVYMKDEFAKASSTVMIYTIIASLFGYLVHIGTHLFAITTIDPSTRIVGTLIITIGLYSSYTIVKKLCDENSRYPNSKSILSIIPEITLILSFIVAPILVSIASFIYDGEPLITTDITYTFVDSVFVIFLLNVVYLWIVWRVE